MRGYMAVLMTNVDERTRELSVAEEIATGYARGG